MMQTFLDGVSALAGMLQGGLSDTLTMLKLGFETAPALMFGLGVIVALPVLMFGGAVMRRVAPSPNATARFRGELPEAVADRKSNDSQPVGAFCDAVIVVLEDGGEGRKSPHEFRFGRVMVVRIGREEDNEIRLMHPTVHRYHAMIRRSFEDGYEISDLSDEAGNGVSVNGEKVSHGRLNDGDVISLGAARLRFDVAG